MTWQGETVNMVEVRISPTILTEAEVAAGMSPVSFADLADAVAFLSRCGVQRNAPIEISYDRDVTIIRAPANVC